MADALKIYSRSNGHNSLQFRPFSTKIWPNYTKFRDATREATPEAAAPQIRPVSVFSHETPSVSSFFDETWCGKKSSPRRICMQSLGQIRAYAYMHMHICICIYAYAYMHMHICICSDLAEALHADPSRRAFFTTPSFVEKGRN